MCIRDRKRAEAPDAYGQVELVAPTRTISTATNLDLGGVSLELHPLPGHTPDTLVGFISEWGTLLAGDAVEAPLPFLNEASPVASWVAGLEEWVETLERWTRSKTGSASRNPVRNFSMGLRTDPTGKPDCRFDCAYEWNRPVDRSGSQRVCEWWRYLNIS